MKLLIGYILFIISNPLLAQTKKYNFQLPKRDSIAFRPYQFGGSFKNGLLYYYIEFEKDFAPQNEDPSRSTSLSDNTKPNGIRAVKFRFEFKDSSNKLVLDTAMGFLIDLHDGNALLPYTEIIKLKNVFKYEPYTVTFSWSFYDCLDLKNKEATVFVRSSSQIIELYKMKCDYRNSIPKRDNTWLPKWF
jgi:hypothetical protein